jgi:autotransporter-associated beta strand protein
VLLAVAGGFAYAGRWLRVPVAVARPGPVAAGFMVAIWLMAIYTAVIATYVYGLQVKQAYPGFVAARVRVGTFVYALATFFVILYLTRRWGWKVALASAVFGTAAAPMIFEFPFDLIVMARTNPPIPTYPMLYRQLFFLPLFLVEFSTVSLLTLLPSVRVTAYATYAVAPGSRFEGRTPPRRRAPAAGRTAALGRVVADQTGSGGTGANTGAASLTLDGAGELYLDAENTFTGSVRIDQGTLELARDAARRIGRHDLRGGRRRDA